MKLLFFLPLTCLLALSGPRAHAGTYAVTNAADDGTANTLRWAIEQANADPGSTINITNNLGTIVFTNQAPLITAAVTINGGASNTVSGNNARRIFFIDTPDAGDAVVINNLTLANGYAKGGDGGLYGGGAGLGAGGAVFVNRGAVTVQNVLFTGNVAQGGEGGNGASITFSYGGGGGGGLGGNGGEGDYYGGGGGGGYGGNGGSSGGGCGGGGGLIGNGGRGTFHFGSFRGGGGGGLGNGGNAQGFQPGTGGTGGGGDGYSGSTPAQDGSLNGGGGGGGDALLGRGGNGGKYGGGGGTGRDSIGIAGDGGEFGGGGGTPSPQPGTSWAGSGGFGGGGGGAVGGRSGAGGFGGGAGGANRTTRTGAPGILGGTGGASFSLAGGGGGGGAAGGAIFVRSDNGATLTLVDSGISGGGATGGAAGVTAAGTFYEAAGSGTAAGSGVFLYGGTAAFQVSSGTSTLISDSISDSTFAGGPAGSISKTGTGTLTLSGTNSFGGALSPNEGVLNINGRLTNNATSGIATTGSTATVNITGTNANWTCTSDTLIGLGGGTGHLNISGGATASDTFSLVGRLAGNTGHVTVTGAGSTWTHSAGLVIGTGGTGTMLVSQGGQVTNTDGTIGGDAGSSGSVTVTGQNSRWTSSAYLVVGGNGSGTLTVSESGTVKVGATGMGTMTLANSGTGSGILNLGAPLGEPAAGAGNVEAGTVAGGSGSGAKTVHFNHTNTSCTFAANLTGNLQVVQNVGTTILTGTNTYTGDTVISNGTLALGESGSLTFRIAGNGTNNAVTGTGSLQASGSFRFNLAAASTNIGNQWIIVAPGLAASYGTNFSVAGFNGANGNWTNTTNGVDYVFQQSTGVLTVGAPVVTNNYQAWADHWQSVAPGFTNTAKTADPDGDSFRNDMEFAFDGNPAVGSPSLLTAVRAGTNAIFNYAARKNPPGGVTYQVKAATNLATGPWTNSPVTVSNSANQSGLNIPTDYERKEFVVPAAGTDFYRVEATIEP